MKEQQTVSARIIEMILAELDDLPPTLLPEVLRFVRFIKSQPADIYNGGARAPAVVTVPAAQLAALDGLIDFTGGALIDTERLYAE